MKTIIPAVLVSLAVLAGCDGENPFTETDPDTGADTSPDSVYGTDLDPSMTMNALEYDDNGTPTTADDILLINNLPFDNTDATGGGYAHAGTLPNGFDRYESPVASAGDRQYFAVFRQSSYAQVAAVGTGDYIEFGFGGLAAQRLGAGNVPAERPATYTFTGDYAAVRITTLDGGTDDVEFITGDATLYADILDFDVTGAVEGIIDNRQLYASDGTFLGTLGDYVSLATAEVDFANAAINASDAVGVEGLTELTSGKWQGIFAGPNGEEIAGIVILEGDVTSAETADTVQEIGTFIAVNSF